MTDLQTKKCIPCEGGVKPLNKDEANRLLKELQGWEINADNTLVSKRFSFKGFLKTMSFVNAVAWVANAENHHPDMEIGFNYCVIKLMTHAIHGLSENDFIVAAKIDALQAADTITKVCGL